MKKIIVYKTKYGSTKSCAEKISKNINCDMISVEDAKKINLNDYDMIIIGTYIKMGMVPKEIIKFMKLNLKYLKTKKISIFILGIASSSDMIKLFEKKIPVDIKNNVTTIEHFGGLLDIPNPGFIEKAVVNKIEEEGKKFQLNDIIIDKFIEKLKD